MRAFFALALLAWAVSCKPTLLPNSDVEDTAANRELYDVVESYRLAMESRDADRVMALVAKDFFDTSGTENPADDYGYPELASRLKEDFGRTSALRLDIHLKSIEIKEDVALIEYRFQSRAHVKFPVGDQWITNTDVNRMRLKRADDGWRIASGL
ncbi:MAG: nuclear transport factor 2 family protein [Deltaproteobacteria bacterium]|nr:nuclear transport factor 2 family protein [Deltaproteobacteria bacterium]